MEMRHRWLRAALEAVSLALVLTAVVLPAAALASQTDF
jgi:hypothetical protein